MSPPHLGNRKIESTRGSALPMPIVPTSLIKHPTAILSNILMIVVISLTAVPSVLHAVALRRVVCEFPGGGCIKSLRLKKKGKKKKTPHSGRKEENQVWKWSTLAGA
jgi:hypothetical protein